MNNLIDCKVLTVAHKLAVNNRVQINLNFHITIL